MNKCHQCPRQCGVRPGYCRVPEEFVLARAGLHRWEEPVISGERGSGTIFFSGCNLRCVFCQNHEVSSAAVGKAVTAAGLEEICHELIAAGAHNINLVTPGHYAAQLAPLLAKWKLPVPVVWNTNSYEKCSTLQQLDGLVQIYLPDLKYADDRIAEKYSHAPDYFATATAAIDEMYRQVGSFVYDREGMLSKGVLIRHLILPGCVENSLRVIEYVSRRFSPGEVLFALMRQYIPCGAVSESCCPELARTVSDEEYALVEEALFASGIEDGFVQDGEAASENFIPRFDTSGV